MISNKIRISLTIKGRKKMSRDKWYVGYYRYNVYLFVNKETGEEMGVQASEDEQAWQELEKLLEDSSVATDY